MTYQRGMLEPPQKHLSILTFDLTKAKAAAPALEALWEDVNERFHDFYAPQRLTLTIGFGLPLFEKLGKTRGKPKSLRRMRAWDGDEFDSKTTQADALVQVCSDDRGLNFQVAHAVAQYLAPAFALRDQETGFGIGDSRGLLGFIDGTGNPKGAEKVETAIVGHEDARHAGGSYMVLRKIRENLKSWERQPVDKQERIIGRRKLDSAPLGNTPANSHKEKSSMTTAKGDVEMLRRSYPYGDARESGLLFICFVRDLQQFEVVKDRMVSPYSNGKKVGPDALMPFSSPISGGYYFIPSAPAEGYPGAFLFGA